MGENRLCHGLNIEMGKEITTREQGVGPCAPQEAQGATGAGSQQKVWVFTAGKCKVYDVFKQ